MICRPEEPDVIFQLSTEEIDVTPVEQVLKDVRVGKVQQAQFCLTKREKCILYEPMDLKIETNQREGNHMIVINRGRNGKLRENSGYSNKFLPNFNSKTLKFWLTRKFSSKKLLLTFLGTKNEAILLSAFFVLVVADQVFTLQQIFKECWECTKDFYICFLDFNKALCTTSFLVKNFRNCCSSTSKWKETLRGHGSS